MNRQFDLNLVHADVSIFNADVLVLKYAQAKYGVDRIITNDLNKNGLDIKKTCPSIGHSSLVNNVGSTSFKKILFIGTVSLDNFAYKEIKRFATHALSALKELYPKAEHIAMTIHGVGYGLDESEALLSQIAGIFEAAQNDDFPENLKRVSIIENNYDRVIRLQRVLDNYLKNQTSIKREEKTKTFVVEIDDTKSKAIDKIISAGESSNKKNHIFVAMPFKKEMYDTFYYGIQQPIHSCDLLCERIDQDSFTGDILSKMKNKIETAVAVIADLTFQNPNVYLEVGYAWGIGKPTILLIKSGDELKFDVQGQKCLQYDGIKHLEDILSKEIKGLIESCEI